MPDPETIRNILNDTRRYLTEVLLPFWIERAPDPEAGGFLTYYDRDGRPTGETDKTFLMQIRTLYTMSAAHRAGYGDGRCAELARAGADFIIEHYWDHEHGGWIWIADRAGRPISTVKIGYGQCFGMYAFSEYYLATGDPRGLEWAGKTHRATRESMADPQHGGFKEIMRRDWSPAPGGRSGGDRKSLDVHMHMMEALTAYYEATRDPEIKQQLQDVIHLIFDRMIHPETGAGYIQLSFDFEPLPAILFDVEWGRDAEPDEGDAQPLDMTSPGHNVELAWLLLHALEVMDWGRDLFRPRIKRLVDHCLDFGIDSTYGGVYADVPMTRPAIKTEKQFWQQAECLVGLLDAYGLFGDDRYLDGFHNVYEFIFSKLVHYEGGGEWFERVDREGRPIDDALGHAWKINYHTVRSMIETVRRLSLHGYKSGSDRF